MRPCRRGHEIPPEDRHCKICAKEMNKKWHAANQKHVRKTNRIWRNKNPENGPQAYAKLKREKPVYTVYNSMIGRCYNPKSHKYPTYGAVGIKVCDRWLGEDGYKNFEIDMGPRPSLEYSIERQNNYLGYSPDNCKWATRKEQQRNRKVNHLVTINGTTKCIAEWCEEYAIKYTTFAGRLREGWTGEKLLRPPDPKFANKSSGY